VSLPHEEEIKAYLRLTTEVEDDLIEQIRLSAEAWIRAFYQVPLGTQTRTFRGIWPRMGNQRERDTRLVVPMKPIAATATVTDASEDAVSDSLYVIDQRAGHIDAKRFQYFGNPPYDIVVSVGWETHPEYDDDIEPILRQAILWAASTYYRNRNVGAVYEQSGGQVSITYTEQAIPPLLRSLMESIKDTAWFA
jgi:hypothetical protein